MGMKRKDSDFLGFFSGVTGTQNVTATPQGWLVDFAVKTVAHPLTERVAGRKVPSLWPGFRWLYWVPRVGHHTALVFLNPEGQPVWCYFDLICGSGEDETGLPWTDDAYLDVIALCELNDDQTWRVSGAEIIDAEDLARALAEGRVSEAQALAISEQAEQVKAALERGETNCLGPMLAYLEAERAARSEAR